MRAHGTYARYVQGPSIDDVIGLPCRCDPCRQANRDYERDRARRIEPAYVAAGRARAHIRELNAAGVGLNTIAMAAQVSHGALSKIIYGDGTRGTDPTKRIRKTTEDRILAVTPAAIADGARVDATETWRHIDELLNRGWTKVGIAKAIISPDARSLQLSRETVTAGNARKVKALLDSVVPQRLSRWGNPIPLPEQPEQPEEPARQDPQLPTFGDEGDTSWMARGACRRPNIPTWMFFPGRGDAETTRRAKAICGTCPVTADCLNYALTHDEDGIWGGTSGRQRDLMTGRRGLVAS